MNFPPVSPLHHFPPFFLPFAACAFNKAQVVFTVCIHKVLVNKLHAAYKIKQAKKRERKKAKRVENYLFFISGVFTARHHSVSRVLSWKLLHSSRLFIASHHQRRRLHHYEQRSNVFVDNKNSIFKKFTLAAPR